MTQQIPADAYVAALRSGDGAAWQRFMKEQGRLILSVGRRVGLSSSERDDLFQSACITAYRSIEQLRDPQRLSSWVYSIAFRQAVDMSRKSKVEQRRRTEDEDELDRVVAEEPSPEEVLQQVELSSHVRASVESMDEPCRSLLNALYLDAGEPSYEEITRRLSMPIGSIGPTRARCLEKLRRALVVVSTGSSGGTTSAKREDPNEGRDGSGGRNR